MTDEFDRSYHTHVDSAGRVLIPAALRDLVHLERGDSVVVRPDGGGLRILPVARAIAEAQEYFCRFKRPGESVVGELLAERRDEGARE